MRKKLAHDVSNRVSPSSYYRTEWGENMEFNALYFCNAHRFNRDMKGFDQTREQCRTDEPELPEIDYAFLDAIAPHRSNTRLRSNQRARNLVSARRCCAVASNGTDRGTIVPPNANSDRRWQ